VRTRSSFSCCWPPAAPGRVRTRKSLRSSPIPPIRRGGDKARFEEFDFGPVLARGQTLHHEFTFTNPTKRPIRLTGATASTPCCSQIGPLPREPIPPGGRCPIPAVLKVVPSPQPEKKRVGFLVQTDSGECPNTTYALSAMVCPDWEVQASADSSRTLPIGRAGRQVIRITSRRLGREGDGLPAKVEADSSLVVRFLGEPREQAGPEGVTSSVRDVEIALPASSEAGPHRGSLRFRWPGGRIEEQPVVWEVVLHVRASPSKLVLKRSERELTHTVTIKAFDDRPFRIRDVGPSHLIASSEFDREARRAHTLKLRIDPERASLEHDTQITIKTDVEDQPIVSLSIVILPPGV
jgi:Protein of unknown function (DUF1573)